MFEWKVFLVALAALSCSVMASCPEEPVKECFTQSDFDKAFSEARKQLELMEKMLRDGANVTGVALTRNDPAFGHFSTHVIDSDAFEANRIATIRSIALKSLKVKGGFSTAQLKLCLKATKIDTSDFCPTVSADCSFDETSYYRSDGKCNSKKNPTIGTRKLALLRLFESGYEDGIDYEKPDEGQRTARQDAVFANERKGKNTADFPETNNDEASMVAQLLTHELVKTKKAQISPDESGGGFNCCNPDKDPLVESLIEVNKYCHPVPVESTDKCFGHVGCLNYIKSLHSMRPGCPLDVPPTPTNFETPYLDGQLIYNDKALEHLEDNHGRFDTSDFEAIRSFIVGYDDRSQQLPALYQFLNYFVLVHNRIFDKFVDLHSDISETILSFETRKIVTALYQKVYLDLVKNVLPNSHKTTIDKVIHESCYDENLNPQVSIEFNICMRNFHYFLREGQSFYNESFFQVQSGIKGKEPDDVPLSALVDNLDPFRENTCGMKHGTLDTTWNLGGVGEQITCKFFAPNSTSIGTDLRSLDYQSARVVGEPKYIEVLKQVYGLDKCPAEISKTDFSKHSRTAQSAMLNLYHNIAADVPFSIGIDLENREGEVLVPTCAAIIAQQVKNSACSDRFFFSNANFFNEEQKDAIRDITYRDILCLTNARCNGTRFQDDCFLTAGAENLKTTCESQEVIFGVLGLDTWIRT